MSQYPQLHVLIAGEEAQVRDSLRGLIASRSEVQDITQTGDTEKAMQALVDGDPDLAFLDADMSKVSGVENAETDGPGPGPATILIGDRSSIAVENAGGTAVDYVRKPFDEDRFARAFERGLQAVGLMRMREVTERFQRLLNFYWTCCVGSGETTVFHPSVERNPEKYLERITVEVHNQIHVVTVEDIRYVTAEDKYAKIHTSEESYLLRERMYEIDQKLDPAQFARIHRSTIVRLDCIERLVQRSKNDYFVQLDDKTRLRISRTRQDDFMQRLKTGAVT